MIKQRIHFKLINEACTLTIENSVFSVMAGLIAEILYMLCNGLKISEHETYWLMGFPPIKSWEQAKKIFMEIFIKAKKQVATRNNFSFAVNKDHSKSKERGWSPTPADILVGI